MTFAPNHADQVADAEKLLASVAEGLSHRDAWAGMEKVEQVANTAENAIRRVVLAAMLQLDLHGRMELGATLSVMMGEHVGRLLRGLPSDTVMTCLTAHSQEVLKAIGADPTLSGVSVTVSDPQHKETIN